MKKLLVIALLLSGCSTTTAQLMSRTDNMQSWTVTAPVDVVFRRYKEQMESIDGIFMGSGFNTSGYFYGESAELSTKMESIQVITCLHLTLDKSEQGTLVNAWRYNDNWQSAVNKLRSISMTKPVAKQVSDEPAQPVE